MIVKQTFDAGILATRPGLRLKDYLNPDIARDYACKLAQLPEHAGPFTEEQVKAFRWGWEAGIGYGQLDSLPNQELLDQVDAMTPERIAYVRERMRRAGIDEL